MENQENNQAPTEGKEDNASQQIGALSNIVNQLATSQQNMLNELNSFKSSINERLEAKTAAPPVEQNTAEDDYWAGFDPDAKKAVQTEVNTNLNKVSSEFNSKLEEREKLIFEKLKQEKTVEQKKAQYAQLLSSEYPQVFDQSHPLHQEYNRVISEKVQHDEDYLSKPEAIYDATAIAYARLVNSGKLVPESFRDEARRLISVNDSSMPRGISSKPAGKVEELSKEQLAVCRKYGINPNKYLEKLKMVNKAYT